MKTVRSRLGRCGQRSEALNGKAFAVKVATKRLSVFPFPGFNLYHHFRNDAFYDPYNLIKVRKTGKREVVLLQPLPQTLHNERTSDDLAWHSWRGRPKWTTLKNILKGFKVAASSGHHSRTPAWPWCTGRRARRRRRWRCTHLQGYLAHKKTPIPLGPR